MLTLHARPLVGGFQCEASLQGQFAFLLAQPLHHEQDHALEVVDADAVQALARGGSGAVSVLGLGALARALGHDLLVGTRRDLILGVLHRREGLGSLGALDPGDASLTELSWVLIAYAEGRRRRMRR